MSSDVVVLTAVFAVLVVLEGQASVSTGVFQSWIQEDDVAIVCGIFI